MNTIPIANIAIHTRLRKLQPESVLSLSASVQEIGLLQPITVALMLKETDQTEPHYTLIAGLHRLEAYKMLGKTEIPAIVITATMAEQRLMEIDENLERAELTHLERAEHLSERKRLYEEIHPETRHGGTPGAVGIACGGKASKDVKNTFLPPSFSKATAQRLNCSESTIQKAVHRATHISPETKEIIRDMPAIANSTIELDALASMTANEQVKAVEAVKSGQAKSVRASTASGQQGKPDTVMTTKPDPVEQLLSGKIDWEGKAKHAEDLVRIQEGHILTYKREITKLRGKIKELGSLSSSPVIPPQTDLTAEVEGWKRRALEAEEQCINLEHRIGEMEANLPDQCDRGAALRAVIDEFETALHNNFGEVYKETLEWFESRFTNLVFAIKKAKNQQQ
ncbi:MAG: ParB N-terminal domain-containing protein [Magnetococcales bacterium]|nr:ParB N-terminal domain-containing protein [Magnetococcales bacterium]